MLPEFVLQIPGGEEAGAGNNDNNDENEQNGANDAEIGAYNDNNVDERVDEEKGAKMDQNNRGKTKENSVAQRESNSVKLQDSEVALVRTHVVTLLQAFHPCGVPIQSIPQVYRAAYGQHLKIPSLDAVDSLSAARQKLSGDGTYVVS